MKNFKKYLDNPIFTIIAEESSNLKIKAFVVGGYVRDSLMGRKTQDIDILALGSGIELAQKIANRLNLHVNIYKNFGTAMLNFDGLDIEFVGARKESYNLDSRKPAIEDGSFEDDHNRRDFTINAIYFSLNADTFGEIIDPFNGIDDIRNKIIKTPLSPEITFSDDPLRMMRAIRFASQLNFNIEDNTFEGIKNQSQRIKIISYERITEELNKIILSNTPSKGFINLDKTGLLQIIFPEFVALKGVDIIEEKAHKDIFYHTLQVLDNITNGTNDLWLRWAAILHDIGKPRTKKYLDNVGWTFHQHEFVGSKMVSKIFQKFKLPLNEKMKFVQKLVLLHLRPIVLAEDIVSDSAVRRLLFDAGDDIDNLMLLCEADITSKNYEKVKKYFKNFEIVRKKLKEIEEKDKIRNWQPPITGEIIMKVFNLKPSQKVGDIKNAIREAILDGVIENNYEQAYNYMLKIEKEM